MPESSLHPAVPPEPRTVHDCGQLQKECRKEIFSHIDTNHKETQQVFAVSHKELMEKLVELKVKAAHQEGVENGKAKATKQYSPVVDKKINWKEVAAAIVIVTAAIAASIAAIK